MTAQSAFIPTLISKQGNKISQNILAVVTGALLLAGLAQISFHLPFTPVPITGQTFGVALIALLWGKSRGVAAVMTYLTLGILGAPVFAFGTSLLVLGPSAGYLVGMLAASYVMGSLADLGLTKSFSRTLLVALLGTVITFVFGVLVLSIFIPKQYLLAQGVLPFVLGDVLKMILVSLIVTPVTRKSYE
jgi:biotin transport system substrate-specific component